MEFKLNGIGANNTGNIWLNADSDNFKVSIIAIPAGAFDGKINVEYSPNGIDWFSHADMTGLTAKSAGNLFFPVPVMRASVAGGTKGTVSVHVFGSLNYGR